MRGFCALAAICIVGAHFLPTIDSSSDPHFVKCATELNLDLSKIVKLLEDAGKPNDDAYRLFACASKQSREEKGSTRTQYEELMQFIKSADEQYGIKNKPYTRDNLESQLTACNSKGLNDYEFLKCIKFLEPPLSDFYVHYG